MEVFLSKVTSQAMNYAIRSGIVLSTTMIMRQGNKLLTKTPKSAIKDELYALQQRLQQRVRIISPAIDMIELIAARGNTSLETALTLTQELRYAMESLGRRMVTAAQLENGQRATQSRAHTEALREYELKGIVGDIKALLSQIEDALPLLNLAITTSGVSLSTNLPHTISPSRLLQASTFLTAGDSDYSLSAQTAVQIGPSFIVTVYMLFAGHNRPQTEEEIRETTWKEVMHKARVKLRRVPLDMVMRTSSGSQVIPTASINLSPRPFRSAMNIPADARSDEFAYQLMVVEDLDDDRVHDVEEGQPQPGPFDDIAMAGIREMIPIHEISKIFYADTSKVLNIGNDAESNHPVLLLKRDLDAVPPRQLMDRATQDESIAAAAAEEVSSSSPRRTPEHSDPWRLPPSLDPEWIAFEVYTSDDADDASSSGEANVVGTFANGDQPSPSLEEDINRLHISSPSPSAASPEPAASHHTKPQGLPHSTSQHSQLAPTATPPWAPQIRTSLSLLELLLRLTSLQQFQQQSHLSITDELLNFFLEESATTGAGGNENVRQVLRSDARRRVGWDPYDESPVKRRGEDYQYASGGGGGGDGDGWSPPAPSPQDAYYVVNSSPGPYARPGSGARPTPDRTRSYNDGWISRPQPGSARSPGSASGSRQATPSQSLSAERRPGSWRQDSEPGGKGSREQWLLRDSERGKLVGSPLRPSTGRSDEGLGTSPASGVSGIQRGKSP